MDKEMIQSLYRETQEYSIAMLKNSIKQIIMRKELPEPRWEDDVRWKIDDWSE